MDLREIAVGVGGEGGRFEWSGSCRIGIVAAGAEGVGDGT